MGESQVACALTGQPVFDECVVIVLGPGGYGDHSAPPKLHAGGCHFSSNPHSEEPVYLPLALPIRARVGHCWGELRACLDAEYDRWLIDHWGANAVDIVNAAIGSGGTVGDAFKRHVAKIDHQKSSMWDEFDTTDSGIENYLAKERTQWERDLARGRLTQYQIDRGLEPYLRERRHSMLQTRVMKECAKRGVYQASWADVLHVDAAVWDEIVGQPENGFGTSWLSPYSKDLFQSDVLNPCIARLSAQLDRFCLTAMSLGRLMPSVIFNHDHELAKIRATVYAVASRLSSERARDTD